MTSARIGTTQIQKTPPPWAGDGINNETILPGGAFIDASQFLVEDGCQVTIGAGGAAANATAAPVIALKKPIPAGSLIDLGGKKFARLSTAAAVGATSISVDALPTALAEGDTGIYRGTATRKPVPSGTLLGRTYAERSAGTGFGPAVVASDDEIYLLALDIPDASLDPQIALYRHNCLVYETRLPDWAGYTDPQKAKIRSLYTCIL
jgi:hypothetical protein